MYTQISRTEGFSVILRIPLFWWEWQWTYPKLHWLGVSSVKKSRQYFWMLTITVLLSISVDTQYTCHLRTYFRNSLVLWRPCYYVCLQYEGRCLLSKPELTKKRDKCYIRVTRRKSSLMTTKMLSAQIRKTMANIVIYVSVYKLL